MEGRGGEREGAGKGDRTGQGQASGNSQLAGEILHCRVLADQLWNKALLPLCPLRPHGPRSLVKLTLFTSAFCE